MAAGSLARHVRSSTTSRDEGLAVSKEYSNSTPNHVTQPKPLSSISEAVAEDDLHQVNDHFVAGSNPNTRNADGYTLLHIAAELGHLAMADLLVKAGADLEARAEEHALTPLLVAVANEQTQMAMNLVSLGSNINATDDAGASALHIAASNNNVALMLALIKKGARIDLQSADGWTPLHSAVGFSKLYAIIALVRFGADVNSRDSDGDTPLITAVSLGYVDCVQQLLAAGANPMVLTQVSRHIY